MPEATGLHGIQRVSLVTATTARRIGLEGNWRCRHTIRRSCLVDVSSSDLTETGAWPTGLVVSVLP